MSHTLLGLFDMELVHKHVKEYIKKIKKILFV